MRLPGIRFIFGLIALLSCFAGSALADYTTTVSNATATGVGIELTSPFDNIPTMGTLPLNIKISNYTSADRTWELSTEVRAWSSGRSFSRHDSFFVEAGHVRLFHVIIDLINNDPNFESNSSGVTVSSTFAGYGVQSGYVALPTMTNAWDRMRLPLVGFSPALETSVPDIDAQVSGEPLGTFADLEKMLGGASSSIKGYQLNSTKFSLPSLPVRWQGYLAFRQIWITGREFEQLSSEQSEALLAWVFQGGALYVVVPNLKDPVLRQFEIEPAAAMPRAFYGLGRVSAIEESGRSIAPARFVDELKDLAYSRPSALIQGETSSVNTTWGLAAELGELSTAAGMVILIMVAYGLLVGPINILVFSRNKRHRLFVTTPIIAASAAALLILFIFLSDGTGGNGNRMIAVLINPAARTSMTLQEQASRTGLLINREFSLNEDTILLPIRFDQTPGASTYNSYSYNSEQIALQRDGQRYSGEWFENRALNSQVLGSVVTSRSGIELLGEQAGRPRVLSSLKIKLDEFYYRDRSGRIWRAQNIEPGAETALDPAADEKEFENWLHDKSDKAAKAISTLSQAVAGRRGYFYGWSSRADTLAVPTVESIDWRPAEALITGAVSSAGV